MSFLYGPGHPRASSRESQYPRRTSATSGLYRARTGLRRAGVRAQTWGYENDSTAGDSRARGRCAECADPGDSGRDQRGELPIFPSRLLVAMQQFLVPVSLMESTHRLMRTMGLETGIDGNLHLQHGLRHGKLVFASPNQVPAIVLPVGTGIPSGSWC